VVALCAAALLAVGAQLIANAAFASRHGQIFPVRGPHGTRGPIGEFGAPRSGGRTHEGFDVTAACGTKLVSARSGAVIKRAYDPVLDGNYVIIHARGMGPRNYLYAHMRKPAMVAVGEVVRTGQRIGRVGKTGNARTVGCHLHFEIHVHGKPVDPEPALRRWDSFS
jgi:murein DD-endopeptidase MepM/ murein hydrolase activator NlpD